MKKNSRIHAITAAALIGAAYAALTMLLAPISYGAIQLRVSELLCVLPYFIPVSAWGLFIGCALANIVTGNVFDIIFGSLATLLAALLTAALGRRPFRGSRVLACLSPVVFNALIVGAVITRAYNGLGLFSHPEAFAINALQVGLGEAAVMLVFGLPLMHLLPEKKFFREFADKTKD